jgi:hypothetical protein
MRKRPYLKVEWIQSILDSPLRIERQEDGRFRCWGIVPDNIEKYGGKVLRVIIESDGETIHNAFPDRNFKV